MKPMHFIRLGVMLLCLILAVSAFVACDSGNDPADTTAPESTTPPASEGVSLKAADYTVVYANGATAAKSAADALSAAATDKLGAAFKGVSSDTEVANTDPNALEILIGTTDRTESTGVLSQLGGALGYVIQLSGSKVVINATSDELLDEAVQYFITEYVNKGASGAFTLPEELLYRDTSIGGISLLDETGKLRAEVVYDKNLDTSAGKDEYDRVDYVVLYINKLMFGDSKKKVDGLAQHLGDPDVAGGPDDKPASDLKMEILVGNTNRRETATFRESLAINEYGYGVVGNKLVITGWSDLTIGKAVDLFIADMSKYITEEGGTKSMILYESNRTVETYKIWNVDLPFYNAGEQEYVMELSNDSYEVFYSNTTLEEYQAYCADLVATKGYQAYQTNQIADNHYGTYTNGTTMIHVYYVKHLNAVRFVTESMKTVVLPQKTDSNTGEKIADLSFTMFDLDDSAGNFGNCFIITLEDGSFIFHDGGGDKGTFQNADRDELYNLFKKLNKREDGRIVIAAWIISHQHWDHIKNGIDFMKQYYREIDLERIIYNVAEESIFYNTRNPNNYVQNFVTIQMQTGCDLVRMHTGQKIQIRNLTLEVIYTTEDLYPEHPYTFNNTTFVHRFDVGEGANKQRVQIVGDIEDVASNIISAMYGDELKCDVLQVAHHGWGGTVELYAYFKPTVVLWPNTQATVTSQQSSATTGYYPTINKSLCNQKNVLLIVAADKGHKMVKLPVLGLTDDRNVNLKNCVTVMPREDGI